MKNLTDVINVMFENGFDYVGDEVKTIGISGKKRTCLLFRRAYNNSKNNPRDFLTGDFVCENYSNGKYYQVYRCV